MSTEQILERPKTGHGNRARSLAQYQFDQSTYQYERPRTHRSNRPPSRLGRESVNYGRQNSFYDRPKTGQEHQQASVESTGSDNVVYASPPISPTIQRPRTSRGRRSVSSVDTEHQDGYQYYERSERLRSSHGRNQPEVEQYPSDDVSIPYERPRTSRGRHRDSMQDLNSEYDSPSESQTYVTSGDVNILSVDDVADEPVSKSTPKTQQMNKMATGKRNNSAGMKASRPMEKSRGPKTSPGKTDDVRRNATKEPNYTSQSYARPSSNYGNRQAASQHDPKTNYHTSPRLAGSHFETPPSPSYIRPSTGKKRFAKSPTTELDSSSDWLRDSSPVVRPGSSASLSRYNILPAIGTPVPPAVPDLPAAHRQAPLSPDAKPARSILKTHSGEDNPSKPIVESIDEPGLNAKVENEAGRKQLLVESLDDVKNKPDDDNNQKGSSKGTQFKPLAKAVCIPPEPVGDEPKLLLAVKLPDGVRVQRNFSPSDQLLCVLQFAEMSAQLDFSGCHLVCDVPRAIFKDLSMTIQVSGVPNRTVLHIQSPDAE